MAWICVPWRYQILSILSWRASDAELDGQWKVLLYQTKREFKHLSGFLFHTLLDTRDTEERPLGYSLDCSLSVIIIETSKPLNRKRSETFCLAMNFRSNVTTGSLKWMFILGILRPSPKHQTFLLCHISLDTHHRIPFWEVKNYSSRQ
jgi:hypothetical protein